MIKVKNYCLRQSVNLGLYLLCSEKKLVLQGVYGYFSVPLQFPLVYSKTQRKLWLKPGKKTKLSFLRLYHVLLFQSAVGVVVAYKKQLTIVGIGYQAQIEAENFLVFKLGFSHTLRIKIPSYVEVFCPKPRIIKLKGVNYQKLSNFACALRRLKLPSVYKEKGIYFYGESPLLKQGKKT